MHVGYASGTDLKYLKVKQGPILDVDGEGMQVGTVGDCSSVVKVGKYYYIAYKTSSAKPNFGNAQWSVALARSKRPDGGWQKLAEGEILSNPQTGFGYDGPELSVHNGRLYLCGISGPAQEIAGRNSLASGVKTTQNQFYLLKSSTYFPG